MSEKLSVYNLERVVHEELMKAFGTAKNLTESQLAHIEEVAGYLTDAQIADYLGMDLNVFRGRLRTDEVLRNSYQTGKSKTIVDCARVVISKAHEQNLNAAMFYLKTRGGWKENQSIEHTVTHTPPTEDDYYDDEDVVNGEVKSLS